MIKEKVCFCQIIVQLSSDHDVNSDVIFLTVTKLGARATKHIIWQKLFFQGTDGIFP